ncbi:unnamed protein product, partial [Protopolystoma xenopodis]
MHRAGVLLPPLALELEDKCHLCSYSHDPKMTSPSAGAALQIDSRCCVGTSKRRSGQTNRSQLAQPAAEVARCAAPASGQSKCVFELPWGITELHSRPPAQAHFIPPPPPPNTSLHRSQCRHHDRFSSSRPPFPSRLHLLAVSLEPILSGRAGGRGPTSRAQRLAGRLMSSMRAGHDLSHDRRVVHLPPVRFACATRPGHASTRQPVATPDSLAAVRAEAPIDPPRGR